MRPVAPLSCLVIATFALAACGDPPKPATDSDTAASTGTPTTAASEARSAAPALDDKDATPHPESESAPIDVGRDDPRRKALLDALRPSIEADLGQALIFEVETLREIDGSAFAVVQPRTPAGKPVDFAKTRHAQRLADGVLDGDTVYAILQHRDGRWQVQEYVVGPTDVAWTSWTQDYAAPEVIFLTGQ